MNAPGFCDSLVCYSCRFASAGAVTRAPGLQTSKPMHFWQTEAPCTERIRLAQAPAKRRNCQRNSWSVILPAEWTITVYEDTAPWQWDGAPECRYVKVRNPNEEYYSEYGEFDYHAFHKFWFCPHDWAGECVDPCGCEGLSYCQTYPAHLLCNGTDHRVFHVSIGQNSQAELPERVKEKYSE